MKTKTLIHIIILKLLDEADVLVTTKALIDECQADTWRISVRVIYKHIQKLAEADLLEIVRLKKLSPENMLRITPAGRDFYRHFLHNIRLFTERPP